MFSFILSAKRLVKGLWRSFKRPQFLSLFTTLFLIILSGTLFYKGTEGWYWLDAMYFAVVNNLVLQDFYNDLSDCRYRCNVYYVALAWPLYCRLFFK